HNATLTRRTTMLSAQLAVLGGFATALSERGDLDAAMDNALVSCFDAGGIAWGVLIASSGQGWNHRGLGLYDPQRPRVEACGEEILARARGANDPRVPFEVPVSELLG